MTTITDHQSASTVPPAADDAVGVPAAHWFVAIVNHNSERRVADSLGNTGLETFVASQPEVRVLPSGKRRTIERVVIPSMVFVQCSEQQRLTIVNRPDIFRFLTNKAGKPNIYGRPVAIIPTAQIDTLRFMLGHSDNPVEFTDHIYTRGERVRVIRGNLKGVQGTIVAVPDGRKALCVRLDMLGCATTIIDPVNIEVV